MRQGKENCRWSAVKALYISLYYTLHIGHEVKYHKYIHMPQFDKTLAHLFSIQILKTKMNVLIKLRLYSHVDYKN